MTLQQRNAAVYTGRKIPVKRTALSLTLQFSVCLGAELGHVSEACSAARLCVRKMNQP